MKRNQKGRIACLMVSLMLILAVTAGCTGKGGQQQSVKQSEASAGQTQKAQENIPTVKLVMPMWGNQTSQDKTKYYDQVLKEINSSLAQSKGFMIDPVIPIIAPDQYEQKVMLMLTSGEQVDAVRNLNSSGGIAGMIGKNALADITDIVNNDTPTLKSCWPENIWKQVSKKDRIYGIPQFNFQYYATLMVRGDYLAKTGMKSPETLAELESLLYAFKDTDLNGTGKKDVLPLTGGLAFFDLYFYPLFSDHPGDFVDEAGNVQPRIMDPGYKEYIRLLNKWYKDGIIDDSILTSDGPKESAMMTQNKLAMSCTSVWEEQWGTSNQLVKARPETKLTYIPAFKDVRAYPIGGYGTDYVAVPASSQNAKYVVAYMDWYYPNFDNWVLANFGIKDLTYTLKDGVIDYPESELADMKDTALGKALIGPYTNSWQRLDFGLKYRKMVDDDESYRIYKIYGELDPAKQYAPTSAILGVVPSSNAKIGKDNGDKTINSYLFDFISGKKDISQWDKMVEDWKKQGGDAVYQEYTKAYQQSK